MSALFETLAHNARALQSATFYPWIVELGYITPTGCLEVITRVVQAPLTAAPEALDLLPDGSTFVRADVFPATRFDDMSLAIRSRYKWHYRAYLIWRKEHAGMSVDPIEIDERAESWARPGRFVGD